MPLLEQAQRAAEAAWNEPTGVCGFPEEKLVAERVRPRPCASIVMLTSQHPSLAVGRPREFPTLQSLAAKAGKAAQAVLRSAGDAAQQVPAGASGGHALPNDLAPAPTIAPRAPPLSPLDNLNRPPLAKAPVRSLEGRENTETTAAIPQSSGRTVAASPIAQGSGTVDDPILLDDEGAENESGALGLILGGQCIGVVITYLPTTARLSCILAVPLHRRRGACRSNAELVRAQDGQGLVRDAGGRQGQGRDTVCDPGAERRTGARGAPAGALPSAERAVCPPQRGPPRLDAAPARGPGRGAPGCGDTHPLAGAPPAKGGRRQGGVPRLRGVSRRPRGCVPVDGGRRGRSRWPSGL